MAATLALDPATLTVEPGAQARCVATVRNTGQVVESYQLDVVGPTALWATVQPASISLLPNSERTVDIVFQPPRSSRPGADSYPFGIKLVPASQPGQSVVEEGDITVNAFTDVGAVAVPRTSRGRRTGRHRLRITNAGNVAVRVTITLKDPDDQLLFTGGGLPVDISAGATGVIGVGARAKRIAYVGQLQQHPFQATVQPTGATPAVVDAVFLQKPVLPRWLPKAAVAAVALVIATLLIASQRAKAPNEIGGSATTSTTAATTTTAKADTTTSGGATTTTTPGGVTTELTGGAEAQALADDCEPFDSVTPTTSTTTTDASGTTTAGPSTFYQVILDTSPPTIFSFNDPTTQAAAQGLLRNYTQLCVVPAGSTDRSSETMVLEPATHDTPAASQTQCDQYTSASYQRGSNLVVLANDQAPTPLIQHVPSDDVAKVVLPIAQAHHFRCWLGGDPTFTSLDDHRADAVNEYGILEYWLG